MKRKKVTNIYGRELYINIEESEHIISSDNKPHREDELDDNMQNWKQWY